MDDMIEDFRSMYVRLPCLNLCRAAQRCIRNFATLLYDAATGEFSSRWFLIFVSTERPARRSAALFWYDYCLTFAQDIRHIWPLRLSIPSLLFVAVRYPALVSTAFIILDQTQWKGMTDAVRDHPLLGHCLQGID